jgi:hypothetical protein
VFSVDADRQSMSNDLWAHVGSKASMEAVDDSEMNGDEQVVIGGNGSEDHVLNSR